MVRSVQVLVFGALCVSHTRYVLFLLLNFIFWSRTIVFGRTCRTPVDVDDGLCPRNL